MQPPSEIIHQIEVEEGRYQFYREHKYVSFVLNDLERLIAKTDFRNSSQVEKIETEFQDMVQMLHGHAEYEDTKLHPLLEEKGSSIFQEAQKDHEDHDAVFQYLQLLLDQIKAAADEHQQIGLGYQFYLNYRKFVGENLHHLHEEETQILPELQRLYNDDELRTVEAETYRQMSVGELIHMMQVLFPHFNPSDRQAFLDDIQQAVPEKFIPIWEVIKESIDLDEQSHLMHFLECGDKHIRI